MEIILTTASCGPACWYAREHICRCSCGGRNHGILLVEGAEIPVRQAKIDGILYELHAVDYYNAVSKIADALKVVVMAGNPEKYKQVKYFGYSDPGAVVRVKVATEEQEQKWPELVAFTNSFQRCYLVWKILEEQPKAVEAAPKTVQLDMEF